MDKVRFFKDKVKEISLLTNTTVDIVTRQDNRLGSYISCISIYLYCDTHEPVYLFRYNKKKLVKMPKIEIVNLILHELGHINLGHETENSGKSLDEMEYEAEKYAITHIKKLFPQYYKTAIRDLKTYTEHDNPLYRKAFTRLVKELKL